jgi:hypothetical protein
MSKLINVVNMDLGVKNDREFVIAEFVITVFDCFS